MLHGQDSLRPTEEGVQILFRNEAEGGLTLHSNGFGISFKRGWHKTGYKKENAGHGFGFTPASKTI